MKSFLLRFKGTIFASAQIKKNDVQNEWKDHVVWIYGPFDKNRAEESPEIAMSWVKENYVHLFGNRLGMALNVLDFDF